MTSYQDTNSSSATLHFDYIITGAGCAGLSLLMRIMQHSVFHDKKILVIDQSQKTTNDRTWCFWETKPGLFESIVHHRWKQLEFYSNYFSERFEIYPYEYKIIQGIDFYNHVISTVKKFSNISFTYGEVTSINNIKNGAIVKIADTEYTSKYVFNSIYFNPTSETLFINKNKTIYSLLQHFKGWLIQTPEDVFDECVATFMDFKVSQQHGTTFMYVLPVSKNTALIEYTLFTEKLLPQPEYDAAIKQYITHTLKISDYSILHQEFGIIPMTNKPFINHNKNIINIGTAGGATKASSGYTFQFIQKQTQQIVDLLINNKPPYIIKSLSERKFDLYDSVLLNVLFNNKINGDKIFADIFRKNPPATVLKFLDNETSLSEDLKILASVPSFIFFPAALKEIFNKMSR